MSGSVEIDALFDDTLSFLKDLENNNTREWFQANKALYDTRLKRPAEKLLTEMSDWFALSQGVTPRPIVSPAPGHTVFQGQDTLSYPPASFVVLA